MANWCNLRLLATGRRADVEAFRRAAGAAEGRIDTRRSTIFTAEMEYGEGGDLEADPPTTFQRAYRTATYRFQGRHDQHHLEHFVAVSRRFPKLAFVLVYSDSDFEHGSYLILNGRRRHWAVPSRTQNAIRERHVHRAGITDENDPNLWGVESEASWETMDLAEQKWNKAVLAWLGRDRDGTRGDRAARPRARA